MNQPMRALNPGDVPWEEPYITGAGHRLHRPAVFVVHVLPRYSTLGAGRTPLPRPAAKPRTKRAKP